MKILVIGGTRYFGIHMVNKLLEQGHEVTIATRGKAHQYKKQNGTDCTRKSGIKKMAAGAMVIRAIRMV